MTNHILNYSGGISSFLAGCRMLEQGIQFTPIFADTLIEDEDLYRFNEDVQQYWGIKIVRLADGRTPWQVFEDVRFQGNTRIDPCSKYLKRELLKNYITSIQGDKVEYFGLDWTEVNRFKRLEERKTHKIVAPLMDPPYWSKAEMLAESKRRGVTPPRLYSMGFQHNNCGGFCVKAGLGQFKLLLDLMPDRYLEHELAQEKFFKHVGKKYGFLRKTGNKETTYLSLQEFRKSVQSGQSGQIDMFDVGGCGCAIDG